MDPNTSEPSESLIREIFSEVEELLVKINHTIAVFPEEVNRAIRREIWEVCKSDLNIENKTLKGRTVSTRNRIRATNLKNRIRKMIQDASEPQSYVQITRYLRKNYPVYKTETNLASRVKRMLDSIERSERWLQCCGIEWHYVRPSPKH
jgi:hypothetical protein